MLSNKKVISRGEGPKRKNPQEKKRKKRKKKEFLFICFPCLVGFVAHLPPTRDVDFRDVGVLPPIPYDFRLLLNGPMDYTK
jgi:hypothetical protein